MKMWNTGRAFKPRHWGVCGLCMTHIKTGQAIVPDMGNRDYVHYTCGDAVNRSRPPQPPRRENK